MEFAADVFSENLKRLRKEAHLTQQEMADKLYVSRQCYSFYERAGSRPTVARLCHIAYILNTTPNALLCLEQKQEVNMDYKKAIRIIDILIEMLSDLRDDLK